MTSFSSFTNTSLISLLVLVVLTCSPIVESQVPTSNTFTFINEGDLVKGRAEYGAYFRVISSNLPFLLCFYNTTPNAYTLALRMGPDPLDDSDGGFFVWEANRGRPVRDKAVLKFGSNGNLVLTDADGTIVWQTNTANKGVVGLSILDNGNMVLHDAKGKFVWQSFDHPTDTLVSGQSLRVGGAMKLVSRYSPGQNIDGPYTLAMEPNRVTLYYKSKTSAKALIYYIFKSPGLIVDNTSTSLTFEATYALVGGDAYTLALGGLVLGRPDYNATYSFLRLETDGNLRVHTYNFKVENMVWRVTAALFNRDDPSPAMDDECQLPRKCGNFGLCVDNQCVACPSPKGLLGWSKACEAPKLKTCDPASFKYYELKGVDHFVARYTQGEGPMMQNQCRDKCTKDCKCLGYFYHTESSRCWTVSDLNTLRGGQNLMHLAFIKTPNA